MPRDSGADRVRLARIGLGLSQQELAMRLGVSRQAIAAIEAGLSDPSLKVAIALARELGAGVEELFSPTIEYPQVQATSVAPELAATRAKFSDVAGRPVALPLAGDYSLNVGFSAADAVISGTDGNTLTLVPSREMPTALIVAGCDPALALLPGVITYLEPRVECLWWPASNAEALALLREGLVHVAGFHLAVGEPLPAVDAALFRFARWREGLAFRSMPPTAMQVRQGLRLANRQSGSEARRMVDQYLRENELLLEEVPGYESSITAHALVGSALAAGVADYGVTTEPVALAFGLGFTELAIEDFILAIPSDFVPTRQIRLLFQALTSQQFRSQLAAIRGYLEVERSGEPVE